MTVFPLVAAFLAGATCALAAVMWARRRDLAPIDWDHESHCVEPNCHNPACHQRIEGVAEDSTPIYELICCTHAREATP